MKTKKCCTCNEEKLLTEFNFKNINRNILHCSCKECCKVTREKNYKKNKQITFDRNKRNRTKVKKWLEEFKNTLSCIKCGENHPACLDFHHRDPSNKEYTISYMLAGTFSLEKLKKEIEKCDVLCSNCHRKLHYDEVTTNRYNKWILKQDNSKTILEKKENVINKTKQVNKRFKENAKQMGEKFGGHNKLSDSEIESRLELIKEIDLMKYGWVKLVSEKLNITHTQTKRFIEKYYKGEYYKRK